MAFAHAEQPCMGSAYHERSEDRLASLQVLLCEPRVCTRKAVEDIQDAS